MTPYVAYVAYVHRDDRGLAYRANRGQIARVLRARCLAGMARRLPLRGPILAEQKKSVAIFNNAPGVPVGRKGGGCGVLSTARSPPAATGTAGTRTGT